jgi:hypothetical protein
MSKPKSTEAVDDAGTPVRHVRRVLCESVPCACPEFGTPEYFALIDKRHGRR